MRGVLVGKGVRVGLMGVTLASGGKAVGAGLDGWHAVDSSAPAALSPEIFRKTRQDNFFMVPLDYINGSLGFAVVLVA